MTLEPDAGARGGLFMTSASGEVHSWTDDAARARPEGVVRSTPADPRSIPVSLCRASGDGWRACAVAAAGPSAVEGRWSYRLEPSDGVGSPVTLARGDGTSATRGRSGHWCPRASVSCSRSSSDCRPPPAVRPAHLRERCGGDADLRERVERTLHAGQRSRDLTLGIAHPPSRLGGGPCAARRARARRCRA